MIVPHASRALRWEQLIRQYHPDHAQFAVLVKCSVGGGEPVVASVESAECIMTVGPSPAGDSPCGVVLLEARDIREMAAGAEGDVCECPGAVSAGGISNAHERTEDFLRRVDDRTSYGVHLEVYCAFPTANQTNVHQVARALREYVRAGLMVMMRDGQITGSPMPDEDAAVHVLRHHQIGELIIRGRMVAPETLAELPERER